MDCEREDVALNGKIEMIEENSASVVYNDLVMEKVKKTKLNVVEAAAKINYSELVAILLDITVSFFRVSLCESLKIN